MAASKCQFYHTVYLYSAWAALQTLVSGLIMGMVTVKVERGGGIFPSTLSFFFFFLKHFSLRVQWNSAARLQGLVGKNAKVLCVWSRRRPTAAAAAALRPWSHWEKKQNMSPLQVQHWSWVDDVQCPSESTKGSLLLTQTLFNRTTALSLVQTSGEVGPWIECLKKKIVLYHFCRRSLCLMKHYPWVWQVQTKSFCFVCFDGDLR